MPRPKSKDELLVQSREEYDKLVAHLDTLTREQIAEPGTVGEWSAKDVVAHLTAWSTLFMGWYRVGEEGGTPAIPAEGYTFKQTPALNRRIFEEHRDQPLDEVLDEFHAAHRSAMRLIESLGNEELFTPRVRKWTKSTTLGAYAVSATCSHYAWALREIRKGVRAKAKAAQS